ncbi:MAG: periplasmic glucans biosynthesis protein [Puniceicoccaceae bacterium 5H]|nr:MAG: periplasmic glucans biosynthesis protein [Puniceicoccaceae bacterium 5H]
MTSRIFDCFAARFIRLATPILALLVLSSASLRAMEPAQINLDYVSRIAEQKAAEPFQEYPVAPDYLMELDYDAYRDIRFNSRKALWREEGLPFRVEFFHPGLYFKDIVKIHEFTDSHVQEIRFVPEFFDYGKNERLADRIPRPQGYAGIRVLYPINNPDVYDEVGVWVGASYFRILGRNQHWGLSARGLALNTGLDVGEEFPVFREFWLGKPKAGDTALTIYALLDSPSVAGAYKFVLTPGDMTTVDVRSRLFFRNEVQQVGIAPFSSMFYFGENSFDPPTDFRPEVHDSDGIFIESSNDERIWRPFVNEVRNRTSIFQEKATPKGFGVMQRDREFANYQDIEAHYHQRPSVWVQPKSDWGPGSVRVWEFRTDKETDDNVAAFWTPQQAPKVGEPYEVAYRLYWMMNQRNQDAYVSATRVGDSAFKPGVVEFVIDFQGKALEELPPVTELSAVVSVEKDAELLEQIVQRNPYTKGWRLILHVKKSQPEGVSEMRAYLKQGEEALTETWSYQWIW